MQLQDPYTARVAEVFNPPDTSWTTHPNANLYQHGYPPTFLIPGGSTAAGRVFSMGTDNTAHYLDVAANGGSGGWSTYSNGNLGFFCENMVMYRPGRSWPLRGTSSRSLTAPGSVAA
jgi:hypothetical protein